MHGGSYGTPGGDKLRDFLPSKQTTNHDIYAYTVVVIYIIVQQCDKQQLSSVSEQPYHTYFELVITCISLTDTLLQW